MNPKTEAYSEIIKTTARIFSGVATSLVSFITIVYTIGLSIPGNAVTVGGYDVIISAKLLVASAAISFSLLLFVCLTLSLLVLINDNNADSVN